MDKTKQQIILDQQLQQFNINKSVVGTVEYYINQDIIKGLNQDEIIEKAKSGVYKLTSENKKAGRVGQKYGEGKKEDTNELHRTSEKNNFKEESSPARVVSSDEKDAHDKKYGMGKYSKESTEKKEEVKKLSPKSIWSGDSYMAHDAGDPNAKPEKVKIISRKRDEGGYFNIEVEYEDGKRDKWYLSDEDFIFEKI